MEKPVLYHYFDSMADRLMSSYKSSKLQKSTQDIGENRENFVNIFLRGCLPSKFTLGKGEIWDSKKNRTGQLDIIILREDAPKLYFGSRNVYLGEGVFAVIEVKSNLTREVLKKAGEELLPVADLDVDFGTIMSVDIKIERSLRIVFAYEGASWRIIEDEIAKRNWEKLFDIICILKNGIRINAYEDKKLQRLYDANTKADFLIAEGKAASLGILYYHLIRYGNTFIANNLNILQYFKPMQYWDRYFKHKV